MERTVRSAHGAVAAGERHVVPASCRTATTAAAARIQLVRGQSRGGVGREVPAPVTPTRTPGGRLLGARQPRPGAFRKLPAAAAGHPPCGVLAVLDAVATRRRSEARARPPGGHRPARAPIPRSRSRRGSARRVRRRAPPRRRCPGAGRRNWRARSRRRRDPPSEVGSTASGLAAVSSRPGRSGGGGCGRPDRVATPSQTAPASAGGRKGVATRAVPPAAAKIRPASGAARERSIPPHGARDVATSPAATKAPVQAVARRSLHARCRAATARPTAAAARPTSDGSKSRSTGAAPISKAATRAARGLAARAASPATSATAPSTTAVRQSG